MKLFNKIYSIDIMGGEPLLHPNLKEIIRETRKILPSTNILLFTNGILIDKLEPKIWKILKDTKTIILVTKYNINLDYSNVSKIIMKNNVQHYYMDNTHINEKIFCRVKYNILGNEDINNSYNGCYHAQNCYQLEDGILYKCPMIPASRHFNKFFGKNMQISSLDGIDIYKKHSKDEILNYFESPSPFCRYCNVEGRENDKKWHKSQRIIEEWT